MSETKKAGVVTTLFVAAAKGWNACRCKGMAGEGVMSATGAFYHETDDEDPEALPAALDALDLVAAWPPELREVVPLVEALTPEGKALLPGVLRAMAEHPGDCAVLEAGLGEPVSTAAKVAAWAGGLGEEDAQLLYAELMAAAWGHREQQRHETANACVTMAEGLRACLGDVLELNAARILAGRTLPAERRVWKAGTMPPVVLPGQVRTNPDGGAWRAGYVGSTIARITHSHAGSTDVPVDVFSTWPLAEDFPIPEDFPC